MAIREQNLEAIAPLLATFSISQTASVDDLKDANIGQAVSLTASNTVGPAGDGDSVIGKLISLTLTDNDDGARLATVQIGGVCRMAITTTYPTVGDRIVGGASGTVKQAPTTTVGAGADIGRGIVLAVNGTTDCVLYLN